MLFFPLVGSEKNNVHVCVSTRIITALSQWKAKDAEERPNKKLALHCIGKKPVGRRAFVRSFDALIWIDACMHACMHGESGVCRYGMKRASSSARPSLEIIFEPSYSYICLRRATESTSSRTGRSIVRFFRSVRNNGARRDGECKAGVRTYRTRPLHKKLRCMHA